MSAWMPNGRAASMQQQHAPVQDERPERTRNAKAQAKHRAKKKAYIEELEVTASKLQIAMGLSAAEVGVLPPPSLRIRELERENSRLRREVIELRRQLEYEDAVGGSHAKDESLSPNPQSASRGSPREHERELKRKKLSMDDLIYVNSSQHSPQGSDSGSARRTVSQPESNGHNNNPRYHFNPATFSHPASGTPSPTYSTYQTSETQSPITTRDTTYSYPLVKMEPPSENSPQSGYNCSPQQTQFTTVAPAFTHGGNELENWVGNYADSARRIHG